MTQNDTEAVIVLTTVPSDFDVNALARDLLDRRLAACVAVLPEMQSIYRWQGRVESAHERQLMLKTMSGCIEMLEAAVSAAHPYEVPEFLVLPVSAGSDAYLAWLRGEADPTRAAAGSGG
jgi:periplasmic divalent cation tolerance protein